MKILLRALFSGSVASVLSGAAIAACSKAENGAYLRGVNSTSQWLWQERAHQQHKPSWRYTGTGAVIHHASSIFWGVLFEAALAKRLPTILKPKPDAGLKKNDEPQKNEELTPDIKRIFGTAALVATVANIVDFKLTPKRLTPGFERHLSRSSLAIVYSAFGLGLAAAAGWRELRNRDHHHRVETNHRLNHQFDYDVIHYEEPRAQELRHAR